MTLRLTNLQPVPDVVLRLRCDPGWSLAPNWAAGLRDYDLWYIWGGAGRMTTSTGTVNLKPSMGIWMRPNRRYEATQDLRRKLCVTAIHFSLFSDKGRLPPVKFRPPFEVFQSHRPAYVDEVTARIVELCHSGNRDLATVLLKALLLDLIVEVRAEKKGEPALRRYHKEKIGAILSEIRDHPEKDYHVAALAARCGYSPDHFARVFHSVTGHAPKEFILKKKMERATALLRESSHTITQIADLLGYRDLAFFSRQFRGHFGKSPAHFRQSGHSCAQQYA